MRFVGHDIHIGGDVLGFRFDEEDVALIGRHDMPTFGVAERDRLELFILVENDHRRNAIGGEDAHDIVRLIDDAGDPRIELAALASAQRGQLPEDPIAVRAAARRMRGTISDRPRSPSPDRGGSRRPGNRAGSQNAIRWSQGCRYSGNARQRSNGVGSIRCPIARQS